MKEPDRQALGAYLEVVNEVTQTTRRASEDFFDCPELGVVKRGQDEVRNLIGAIYDGFAADSVRASPELQRIYWAAVQRAKDRAVLFGAADHDNLGAYFKVDAQRSAETISTVIRQTYEKGSVPRLLLDAIEAYASSLDIATNVAARAAIQHLTVALPYLVREAQHRQQPAQLPRETSLAVFRNFADKYVPEHINQWRHLKGDHATIQGLVGKPASYPRYPDIDLPAPLTMSVEDARGIMAVYPLQKMGFTTAQLELANTLAQDPKLQDSLIAFQLAVVAHSLQYLHAASDPLPVLPITEFFVLAPDVDNLEQAIAPNPKLIQVICNNLLPAIAAVMLEQGAVELTGEHIEQGIHRAVRMRVFHLQIGQFNNYDHEEKTVELVSMFPRICPAMAMLTTSLTKWLPQLFQAIDEFAA